MVMSFSRVAAERALLAEERVLSENSGASRIKQEGRNGLMDDSSKIRAPRLHMLADVMWTIKCWFGVSLCEAVVIVTCRVVKG
jgi:hypothetical protein